MVEKHRLYFLIHLKELDWNDLYHASHSFLYSLKKTYQKKLKKDPNALQSKNLVFFEIILNNKSLLKKNLDKLENIIKTEIEKSFSLDNFDKDLNYFLGKVDDFFATQKLITNASKIDKQMSLVHFFTSQNEDNLVEKKISSIKKLFEKNTKHPDSRLCLDQHFFYKRNAYRNKNNDIQHFSENIKKSLLHLNSHFVSNSYKFACSHIILLQNYSINIDKLVLPIFPDGLITNDINLCYYESYQILDKIQQKKYSDIKAANVESLLKEIQGFENYKVYSKEDILSLYQIKLNICVYLFPYNKHFGEIFKNTLSEMIAKEILLESESLNVRLYKKAIEVLAAGGFKNEAIKFHSKFSADISPQVKEQFLNYCEALLDFETGKLKTKTLENLKSIKQTKHDSPLYLSSRKLLLKYYYRQDYFDDYDKLAHSIQKYLKRNEETLPTQIVEEDSNFLNVFKFIISNKLNAKDFKTQLALELKKPLHMLDLQWLNNTFYKENDLVTGTE